MRGRWLSGRFASNNLDALLKLIQSAYPVCLQLGRYHSASPTVTAPRIFAIKVSVQLQTKTLKLARNTISAPPSRQNSPKPAQKGVATRRPLTLAIESGYKCLHCTALVALR